MNATVKTSAPVAILSLAAIDAIIASITKKGEELRNEAHSCLVAIIDHYIDNGDMTRLPTLLKAVNGSIGNSQAQAMVQWVQNYVTSLSWNEKTRAFEHMKKTVKKIKDVKITKTDKDGNKTVVFEGNARDYAYYNLEIKKDLKPFDLVASMQSLLNRAQAAYEKNTKNKEHNAVSHAQIEALKGLLGENGAALTALLKPAEIIPAPEAPKAEEAKPEAPKAKAKGEVLKSLSELGAAK